MNPFNAAVLLQVQQGPQILIVEDNALIAMHMEDILVQLGCTVVKAGRIKAGLHVIDTGHLDGAFLDVDVSGESIQPIAERLEALAIPFAFVTGGAERIHIVGLHDHPVLSKPLAESRFAEVVAGFALIAPAHQLPLKAYPIETTTSP